jgi:hypothetical protein
MLHCCLLTAHAALLFVDSTCCSPHTLEPGNSGKQCCLKPKSGLCTATHSHYIAATHTHTHAGTRTHTGHADPVRTLNAAFQKVARDATRALRCAMLHLIVREVRSVKSSFEGAVCLSWLLVTSLSSMEQLLHVICLR